MTEKTINSFYIILKKLINLTKKHIETFNPIIKENKKHFLINFLTIRLQGSRQIGHTTAIQRYIHNHKKCICFTHLKMLADKHGFLSFNDIGKELIGKRLDFNVVFIDNASMISENNLNKLYEIITYSDNLPIIVLLG